MILITGATGNNGQELVRQLSAMGQPVRALVRNPSKAADLKGPNIELAAGTLSSRKRSTPRCEAWRKRSC